MGFVDTIQSAFKPQPAVSTIQYGDTKEWFLSDAGRKVLHEVKSTVELADYTYHYLKSILFNKNLLSDEDLYRLAFVLADSIAPSNLTYAGKDNLLNENVHPFMAYFQRLKRSLSAKALCYEMVFILFGVVNPFDPTEWIYDSSRLGYSEDEYKAIAECNNIAFEELLKKDYTGQEDMRLIICEIIWLIGKKEFLEVIS